MNIAVSPAEGLPVPPPAPIAEADEPIIQLIRAYEAGVIAFNEIHDDVINDPELNRKAAAETYGPALDALHRNTPQIHTVQGAIVAMRFAKAEIHDFADVDNVRCIIYRTLEFLESAAGATLVHPDAELLRLGASIEALELEDEAIDAKLDETTSELRRLQDDRDGLRFTQLDLLYFGYGPKDDGRSTFTPWKAKAIKPYDLSKAAPICRQRCIGHNERLAEIQRAADRHQQAIDAFEEASGRNALCARSDDIFDIVSPVREKILKIPAKTVAGFAVKARLAKRQNMKMWSDDPDLRGFDEDCLCSLVDDILSVDGTSDKVTQPQADPIFKAIEDYISADAAWQAAPEADDLNRPYWDRREAALQKLGQITPSTAEGKRQLLTLLFKEECNFLRDDNSPVFPALVNIVNAEYDLSLKA
ncbi:hypothetical protein LMIY3S_03664 [Labrys miyagiensis]